MHLDPEKAWSVDSLAKLMSRPGRLPIRNTSPPRASSTTAMAFLDIPSQEREAMGVVDGLVRFSVGIEHIDDIIADVDRAIEQMHIEI